MGTSFESNLLAQLSATPDLKRRGKRILTILNARPSKRRTRQIAAMESNVRDQLTNKGVLNTGVGVGIDWSQIDWAAVLNFVLQLLIALLPFLLGL